MKKIQYKFITMFFVLLATISCSRRDVITEHFEAQKGESLALPIEHFKFPYSQTNVYFEFEPAIQDHESRDFSDVVEIKAFNDKNEIEKVKQIYDINGAGKNIQVSFEKEKLKIIRLEIIFNITCSGRIEILSWQPL